MPVISNGQLFDSVIIEKEISAYVVDGDHRIHTLYHYTDIKAIMDSTVNKNCREILRLFIRSFRYMLKLKII
jgi:hypothetical protein